MDDAQLEKGSVPGAYNLLSAGFGSSETHGWRASDNTAITKGSVSGLSSDCLPYRFEGNVDEAINMYQILYGVQGRGFTFSGWVYAPKSTAPYKDNALDKRYFGLRATVSYSNNDSDPPVYIPFNPAINGKQYACGTVIPSRNEVCQIKIEVVYDYNINEVEFYELSLVESAAADYTYNDAGNIVSVSTAGLEQSTYTYDEATNSKLLSFSKGSISGNVTYNAPQSGYLPSSVTTGGIVSEYTYDSAGNVIGTVLRPEAISPATIKTSADYNDANTKLVSTTDERGTVTAYTYNADGSVKSVTLDDVETEYLYGKKGRQSQIWIDDLASVRYFYDSKGNLYHIDTGGIDSSGSL